jgi:hypothetical protein
MQFLAVLVSRVPAKICGRQNSHDAKRKRSLEHGALAVDIPAIAVARDGEEAEVSAVRAVGRPVGAVGVCDSTERVDSTDESADKQQIDKGNKVGRVPRTRIQEQGAQRPGRAEHRDDEEHEDGARREEVALVVPAHEPRKHAERGDQRDDLHDPPEDEGDAGDGHGGGGTLSGLVVVSGLVVEGEGADMRGCSATAQDGATTQESGAAGEGRGCRRAQLLRGVGQDAAGWKVAAATKVKDKDKDAGVQRDSGLVVAKMSDVDAANQRVRGGW